MNTYVMMQTQSLKMHEADNAKYKEKVHKLEESVEKVKKMAHEEMTRELTERDKAMVVHLCLYVYVCVRMYVCMDVRVYVCMYVYAQIH